MAYVSIRRHASAYVSMRQLKSFCPALQFQTHAKSEDVWMPTRQKKLKAGAAERMCGSRGARLYQHTSAYVSIRQHTSAYVSIRGCEAAEEHASISEEEEGEEDASLSESF
jgi:hypothetical protein